MLTTKNAITLPQAHRERILAIQKKHGVYQAAAILGVSRQAIDRAIGGLAIQKGTAALVAQQIAKRDADGKQP